MIHIDDLVRQRLSGGEERERSGAWANMRELLDQKMPTEAPPGGFRWKRAFGLFGGLLLLATLTVGSYHVMTSTKFRGDSGNTGNSGIASAARKSGGSVSTLPKSIASSTPVVTANNSTPAAASAKNSTRTSAVKTRTTAVSATAGASNSAGMKNGSKPAATLTGDLHAGNRAVRSHETEIGRITPNAANSLPANTNVSLAATAHNVPAQQPVNRMDPASSDNEKPGNTPSKGSVNTDPLKNLSAGLAAADNTKVKVPAPLKPELKKDSVQKLTVIQRYVMDQTTMTRRLITDTMARERVAINFSVKKETEEQPAGSYAANNSSAAVVPAAANASASMDAASTGEVLVPLSNFKVHSRRTNNWDAQRFNDVVRDVKFNLAQVKFYPGIIGGYNKSMFGTNDLSGFHLGLFGLFTFGEHINLMTELKYMYRINNGNTLQDNYYRVDSTTLKGQYLHSKVEHFFKFSAMQSIEMPIAIRYAMGRLNLMGGLNMAYNFRINAEEIEHQFETPDTSGTKITLMTAPSVNLSDFNSRFSMGALLGVAYEFSPSLQLDLRMTKNIWDNAGGNGAQRVSREYFRAPSFQVSLGYRFSQRNQIPKAR